MKILFPHWKSFGVEDITEAFEKLGHTVVQYEHEPSNYRIDPKYKSTFKKYIRSENIELVFTSNYFPVISDACNDTGIIYISWCYDNPLVLTYSKTIFNPCNRIFIFDSQMASEIKALGAQNVYYMPMAVNAERLSKMSATPEQKKIIEADVSFVGSLYTEKHTLYDRMTKLDAHTRGYLEGVMASQMLVYGYSFIENTLTPQIIKKMQEAMPLETTPNGMETVAYTYANYFLCRKMTQTERTEILDELSKLLSYITTSDGKAFMPLKLYTPAPTPFLPNVENMGTIHYMYEMPLVFQNSKINLNITLRSIKSGIPLRAMDIMGAGGFLLTNYQDDFNLHFTDGEDFVSYSSREDLYAKVVYFLTHENERKEIAANGCRKVRTNHTYEKSLAAMLETI